MTLLSKLFPHKQDSFNREGLIVKTAFVCGGIEYLEIENVYQLPYHRGLQATRVYEEVRMKCDYDFLKAHCQAVNNIFIASAKLGFEEMSKLKKLNDQLLERLNNIIDTDLIYKLASVIFFDKTESPFDYDWEYSKKKIAHWKKSSDTHAFFLQEPLQRLVPFLKQQEINFQTYSEVIQELNQLHWGEVFSLLSASQQKGISETKEFYAGATRQNLIHSKN